MILTSELKRLFLLPEPEGEWTLRIRFHIRSYTVTIVIGKTHMRIFHGGCMKAILTSSLGGAFLICTNTSGTIISAKESTGEGADPARRAAPEPPA